MQVFVSHHSSTRDVAMHVTRFLEAHGITCWVAPRDVRPGEDWDAEISRGLGTSAAFILLFSQGADDSRHVKRELMMADQAGLPVFLLRLEDIQPDRLQYLLVAQQWIDWIDRRDATLDALATRLTDIGSGAGPATGPRPVAPVGGVPHGGSSNNGRVGRSRRWLPWVLGSAGAVVALFLGQALALRIMGGSADTVAEPDTGLLVNVEYPEVVEFCGKVDLGLPPSAPAPTSFQLASASDVRKELYRQGAKPIGNGSAVLRLTMPPEQVAYIVDIRPLVFERNQPKAEWRYVDSLPCGGPVWERTFFINFDDKNPTVEDLGAVGGGMSEDPMVREESLGREFTVSEVDPIRINVVGMSCENAVSWGLEIEYIQGGASKVATVGTPNEPFVIYNSDVPTYTPIEGENLSFSGELTEAPATPNSCLDLGKG